MIGNKLEQDIVRIFNRDVALHLSINQISKKLKKSYPYINTKVNELIDAGVLNKKEVGRSYLCSVNLNSEKAILLLSLNEVLKKEKHLKKLKNSKIFTRELNDIKEQFKIYTVLFSGKKLIFILDHIHDKEAIKNTFSEIKKHSLQFFTKEEFQNHLVTDYSIVRDHVIMYSAPAYYEIIQEVQEQLFMKHSGLFK